MLKTCYDRIWGIKVCYKKILVRNQDCFDFIQKKVDDLTCTTEIIFRREKTVAMDKEACNFILLVILLEKMMRVAKMCYWMRLILPPKA